jgi:hypothetical protein
MPLLTNTSRFVLLTLLFVLAWNFNSSLVDWGWPTAAVITVAMTSVYTWYVWRHHESLLGRILLFGLETGWTELLADRWPVDTIATLVNLPGGPFWCVLPCTCPSP